MTVGALAEEPLWRVVGGGGEGGIIVRAELDLKSPPSPTRLGTGAVVEGLELQGNRLKYRKLSGPGPEEGWVSVRVQDRDLLVRLEASDLREERSEASLPVAIGDLGVLEAKYCLLRSEESGEYLSAGDGCLSLELLAGDACLWTLEPGSELVPAEGGLRLHMAEAPSSPPPPSRGDAGVRVQLRRPEGVLLERAWPNAGLFTLLPGPEQRPSEQLAELRERGLTILQRVVQSGSLAHLKAELARVRGERLAHEASHDGHFWMMDMLKETPALARAVTHPVALWILREYMGGEDLHFCHQPIVNVLRPARKLIGSRPGEGQNDWHTDYPYHEGRILDNKWPQDAVLGVQFNICVDPFHRHNGATQFLPGSHLRNSAPMPDILKGGPLCGAVRSQAKQLEAPAGAAILYDARTWHRQCPEMNTSGFDRIAILNAVSPSWVIPMLDKVQESRSFARSSVPKELNPRDRAVLQQLCFDESWSSKRGIVKGRPRNPQRPEADASGGGGIGRGWAAEAARLRVVPGADVPQVWGDPGGARAREHGRPCEEEGRAHRASRAILGKAHEAEEDPLPLW